MSSRQAGLSAYAGQVFGASSEEAAQSYEMGDVNTTLIHTAKGRTILLQYDVTTPRPVSYTHLDVYKRQAIDYASLPFTRTFGISINLGF